jgi:1-deoxy-D-xylulose-5-phosphate reductoisomerase
VVADPALYKPLKDALGGSGIEAAAGPDALVEAGGRPADWVMAAIVGAAGIAPTLAAVARGAVVAFANKETLVCAGTLMTREIARNGATLLPVDSEHSAIFQVLEAHNRDAVERLILTASGGPFRTASVEAMRAATPEQAVAHPVWSMGAKISVDSATLMNKALEIIEARHLFQLGEERIEVVVHPESVIHSMVGYVDGSVLAQLGSPDMRTPISYALAWPERMVTPVERLDLVRIAKLTFEAPDPVRFPALRLARECLRAPASASAVFNAANEVAVQLFLDRKIGFLDIVGTVERTLAAMPACALDSLEQMLAIDGEARARAHETALTPA